MLPIFLMSETNKEQINVLAMWHICVAVGCEVASDPQGPQFKSQWQTLHNYLLLPIAENVWEQNTVHFHVKIFFRRKIEMKKYRWFAPRPQQSLKNNFHYDFEKS